MFEGLFAALALFFSPHADEVRTPEPLVSIDMRYTLRSPGYVPPPQILVSLDREGAMWVDGEPQRLETLGVALHKKSSCNADGDCSRIFILADVETPYTMVLRTMSALKHNGFTRIGLIDESSS